MQIVNRRLDHGKGIWHVQLALPEEQSRCVLNMQATRGVVNLDLGVRVSVVDQVGRDFKARQGYWVARVCRDILRRWEQQGFPEHYWQALPDDAGD